MLSLKSGITLEAGIRRLSRLSIGGDRGKSGRRLIHVVIQRGFSQSILSSEQQHQTYENETATEINHVNYDELLRQKPEMPEKPEEYECCGNGCQLCVWDRYAQEMEHYKVKMAAWTALVGKAAHPPETKGEGK
eukprot:TRINITY_DN5619_c0_g1_i4.p1 TRINITY_DN5619_c0_g1~~TRINITY_DN5619_c0_g1_i4.p1  ORF type:complete len:134 (+),score=21.43 TRINITY_DN5619_c0_g1_i4:131-532(+)